MRATAPWTEAPKEEGCLFCGPGAHTSGCPMRILVGPLGEWVRDAACRNAPPEIFEAHGYTEAQSICAGCPVKHDCLEYAIDEGMHGIWGGTTEAERNRHGRSLKKALEDRRARERRLQEVL